MIDGAESSPRRYVRDSDGNRVLVGLSPDETREFETLDLQIGSERAIGDTLCLFDHGSRPVGVRWRALYAKHDTAWRDWLNGQRAEMSPV